MDSQLGNYCSLRSREFPLRLIGKGDSRTSVEKNVGIA